MQAAPAIYLGKIVSKENFRAFIYSPSGTKKLVESWDAFQAHMSTGLWFASKKDLPSQEVKAEEEIVQEKPKPVRRERKQKVEPKVVTPEDKLGFEVKPEDDFLSDARE